MHHKVFIIVLNWNGKEDTLDCLESVLQIDYPQFHVIVVDNGSSDDSVRTIQDQFPEVTVLETGNNLGYAGGNNFGIRYALKNGADYILLLNNDVIVDSQLLKNFINASILVSKPAIFAAKIYYFSQPNKIWWAGSRQINQTAYFTHIGQGSLDNGKHFSSMAETDFASGCALFVNAEVLNKIGLFDEKFFLTYEETDLCYRARRAGFKSFFVPEAKVWHKVSISFGGEKSPLFKYFLTRNKLLWAEKHMPFFARLLLYKRAFYEFLIHICPPRFRLNRSGNASLPRKILRSLVEYRTSFIRNYKDPVRRAKLRGISDYFLRRFGNCTESIRSLGK